MFGTNDEHGPCRSFSGATGDPINPLSPPKPMLERGVGMTGNTGTDVGWKPIR